MIIASRKPLDEIAEIIGDYKKVLIVGCGTCVEICHAGGRKEVEILASQLNMKLDNEELRKIRKKLGQGTFSSSLVKKLEGFSG